MKGYHYTDSKFQESIKENGLELYPFGHTEYEIPATTPVIFVFTERPTESNEMAFVIRQFTKFDCISVSLYEVDYTKEDEIIPGVGRVEVTDSISIEDRIYDNPALLLGNPVPKERVTLLGEFTISFHEKS